MCKNMDQPRDGPYTLITTTRSRCPSPLLKTVSKTLTERPAILYSPMVEEMEMVVPVPRALVLPGWCVPVGESIM